MVCENGNVHALITVDNNDSIANMARNYKLSDNTSIFWYNRSNNRTLILANNWTEMTSIDRYGFGSDVLNGQLEGTGKGEWTGDFPWTGSMGDNCNQWTSNGGSTETGEGPHGTIGGVEKEYLFASDGWAGISFATVCKNKRYLRCVCEGNLEDITER